MAEALRSRTILLMHRFPARDPHKRAFTLMELIVAVVVLGLLATIAFMAFRATIDRSMEAKQRQRMASLLREARTLYVQKIYQDPAYTWQQAVIDASADLPTYKTNALDDPSSIPEGISATGGTNLNTGSNDWTLESDTGASVYSTVSSELVFKVQSSTLYVASFTDSTRCVFGMVSQDTPPAVWSAGAVGSSCDAESATSGPPSSGAYVPGTTGAVGPTISYASGMFSLSSSSQVLSPTTSGSPTSFSYTGTLPTGVTFSASTGAFTGPAAWNPTVTDVAMGGSEFTCAVLSTGAVKCWGDNTFGQLGDGTQTNRLVPTQVTGLTSGVASVVTGYGHACVLLTSGAVKCWGSNASGNIGDGTTVDRYTPAQVSGLSSGVAQIAAGGDFTCARLTSGAVMCWGGNDYGQLGDGTSVYRYTPTQVSGLTSGVSSLSTQNAHACVVLSDGSAKCWGLGQYGRLGDGTTTTRRIPTQVTGLTSGVTQISAGGAHTCALLSSGAVKCWGYGIRDAVGDGSLANRLTPTQVSGLTSSVSQISAGSGHTCALITTGAAKCWGANDSGVLGDGTVWDPIAVVQVSGLTSGVAQIFAGANLGSAAIMLDGSMKYWGANWQGGAGNGSSGADQPTPGAVSTLSGNAGIPALINVSATGGSGTVSTSVTLTVS